MSRSEAEGETPKAAKRECVVMRSGPLQDLPLATYNAVTGGGRCSSFM